MKILQLIDSLHPGGAERMAVNYANALNDRNHNSHLICTRSEGKFKMLLGNKVGYCFIKKKHALDIFALRRLYIQQKKPFRFPKYSVAIHDIERLLEFL